MSQHIVVQAMLGLSTAALVSTSVLQLVRERYLPKKALKLLQWNFHRGGLLIGLYQVIWVVDPSGFWGIYPAFLLVIIKDVIIITMMWLLTVIANALIKVVSQEAELELSPWFWAVGVWVPTAFGLIIIIVFDYLALKHGLEWYRGIFLLYFGLCAIIYSLAFLKTYRVVIPILKLSPNKDTYKGPRQKLVLAMTVAVLLILFLFFAGTRDLFERNLTIQRAHVYGKHDPPNFLVIPYIVVNLFVMKIGWLKAPKPEQRFHKDKHIPLLAAQHGDSRSSLSSISPSPKKKPSIPKSFRMPSTEKSSPVSQSKLSLDNAS